jgi:UDP-N-acetyl-D-galactosamine dehydrogenase
MNPPLSDTDGRMERVENDGTIRSRNADGQRSRRSTETTEPQNASVCVIGLGYVGLPLAIGFAEADYGVIGYDIDAEKIETLRNGTDTTGDLDGEAVAADNITYTSNPSAIGTAEYVVIAVPTPVERNQQPNLEFVRSAGETVGASISPGTTVILESTVYPGATREVLVPAIENTSGLTCGDDFYVGYSPERATPGDDDHTLRNVVKVVSGQNDAVLDDVSVLYDSVVDAGVYRAPSIEVAEACKLVENVQRDLNIALMNELSMAFKRMDLDTQAVLEAAGTKWNFHDYRPGLVGGHCIPVDPYFFAHRSKREGFVPELMLTSREVNESMPDHVATVTIKALNQCEKTLKHSRLLLLGLTYKSGVADIRTSKVAEVVDHLREYDVEVVGYDPHGDNEAMRDAFDVEVQETLSFEGMDGVILSTPHGEFEDLDHAAMASQCNDDPVLVDVTGALDPAAAQEQGIAYRRV